jgi:hypothetical protein
MLHLPELISIGAADARVNNFMGTSEPNTFQTQELRGLIDQINPWHNDSRNETKAAGHPGHPGQPGQPGLQQNLANNLGLERLKKDNQKLSSEIQT